MLKGRQGLGQALLGKNADFYLSHIQPRDMNGSIMDFQALCELPGNGRLKGFILRSDGMDIQIIHH